MKIKIKMPWVSPFKAKLWTIPKKEKLKVELCEWEGPLKKDIKPNFIDKKHQQNWTNEILFWGWNLCIFWSQIRKEHNTHSTLHLGTYM